MKKDNEQKVCQVVIDFISKQLGETLSILEEPDKKERRKKAVELLVGSKSVEFVIEHTRIESYPNQIKDDNIFAQVLGPLQNMFDDPLPRPGYYSLFVDCGVSKGIKNSTKIRQTIKEWVYRKAPTLKIKSPPHHYVRELLPEVPFEVALYRWESLPKLEGKLLVGRFAPQNLEAEREVRIQKATKDKCPKLRMAKGTDKISVLVLESNDIALANHVSIANIVAELISGRTDAPDKIYLVETEIKPWVIWVIKDGASLFPHVEDSGPHYVDNVNN